MLTCDRCQDLLWDELYGLLDASVSQGLHRHLESCSSCRSAMQKAEAGQRLLARVARLDVVIAPFTLPDSEQAPAALIDERGILEVPRRRSFRVRPRWAMAAAVLICLGLPYGIYQNGLSQRAQAYERVAKEVEAIEAQAQALETRAHMELKSFQTASLGRHVHLQVIGPQVYQAGLLTQYRVRARSLDGRPRHVELTARLSDGDKVLFEKRFSGTGEFHVALPSDLPARPRTQPTLEFTATGLGEEAKLQEKLTVLEARYITGLATDKDVYHPGDTIYFRSLTLEPFDLKPPDRPLQVTYTLRDTQNVTRQRLEGLIHDDGSGNGSFVLAADAKAGNYSVGVTQTRANRFSPVSRKFTVLAGRADGVASASAPPATSPLKVEFFPEGGALIAGVPNRVYFRADNGDGPIDIAGQVVDSQGRQICGVATGTGTGTERTNRGVGIFTLSPQQGEAYTLSVTSPAGTAALKLPTAVSEGVALSIPDGGAREGESLPILLQLTGAERQVIVALSCRGSLVAEEALTLKPGATEVTLKPAPGTRGVVRVMVLEARKEKLQLVAERLAYCAPSQRLELGVRTDKPAYQPGVRVALKITTGDEKGQPEQSWLLVSTGKRDALSQASGWLRELPSYLSFSTSLAQAGDIELAYFLPEDNPRAKAALDLFLGTQGWLRVLTPGDDKAAAGQSGSAGSSPAMLPMFALDNGASVKKLYDDEMGAKLKTEKEALAAQVHDLENARASLFAARGELDDYRVRVQGLARTALATGALVTLVLGTLLLILAIVGMARGAATYRPRLVGAFSLLLLCLLSLPVSNWLGSGEKSLVLDSPGLVELPSLKVDIPELPNSKTEAISRPLFAPISVVNTDSPPPAGNHKPLPLLQFAFKSATAATHAPDTLLWQPILSGSGQAELSFDLPKEPGVYRIHVEGHGRSGRLGVAELTIDTRPAAK